MPVSLPQPETYSALSAEDFLRIWQEDGLIKNALHRLEKQPGVLHFKGLRGSMDAILVACAQRAFPKRTQLLVLNDAEETAYMQGDLLNLLGDVSLSHFPASYQKSYRPERLENANVLQRTKTLNTLVGSEQGQIILSYPDALAEKVVAPQSLTENTLTLQVGEESGQEGLIEILNDYGFVREEFVYEAGQFSVRGGILDVFSFADEMPYRLEFFGDKIESIRLFDPFSQLSVASRAEATILPDLQNGEKKENHISVLNFLPPNAVVWMKDYQLSCETIDAHFTQAQEADTTSANTPKVLYDDVANFTKLLEKHCCILFGNRFGGKKPLFSFDFEGKPQDSFNKDFALMTDAFRKNRDEGKDTVLLADSARYLSKLQSIFMELDPALKLCKAPFALRAGFSDAQRKIACYTDHQIFERHHHYKRQKRFSKSKALSLKALHTLNIGDFVTHTDYGIGRFGGMEKIQMGNKMQEAIRLVYKDDDLLYTGVHALHKISKYSGKDGKMPKINKLGTRDWAQKKKNVRRALKDIAKELIGLYAKRKEAKGFAFSADTYLQAELETSFIYEDTPDQAKATEAVKKDMESAHPMDRLICGDVGFGKTEVAIRAAFKAVADNKQVAVLVPTTILAMQHYKTFSERLAQLPCKVEYINRFRTAKEVRQICEALKNGQIDILIGTQRIISKDLIFKDLGLLVVDEEQKFGVKTKDKLKTLRLNLDVLTLTATPIPRTLHFSLMGARDLSIIATPPPNRQAVTTELHNFDEQIITEVLRFELQRGGQAFFVHNRVSDIEKITHTLLQLLPDARVAYAHGQMEGKRLEKIMRDFIEAEFDILVSTNIIESGLDIPNANTIIINKAHMFGLSDLHQMRGRVGRSDRKGFCYLLTPPLIGLPPDSRKRLSAVEEFSDLGDGFKVAMRDLDIRGAGNLLGAEQSGFIADLGFDLYNKILEDAVNELKNEDFKTLFEDAPPTPTVQDCSLETDFEILIPETYVADASERLNLYMQIDALETEEALKEFRNNLADRFGRIPTQVADLFSLVRLRRHAKKAGFEKVILKKEQMKIYLPQRENQEYYQSEGFGKLLGIAQKIPHKCRFKETSKRMIFVVEEIVSLSDAFEILEQLVPQNPEEQHNEV